MSGKKNNLWFAGNDEKYEGTEPCFWDCAQFAWIKKLEESYPVIFNEVESLFGQELNSYEDNNLQYPPKSWTKLVFYVWGVKNHKAFKMFPKTAEIIEKIPNMTGCFISLMEPHSKLKAHCGDTNANLRCHMGLKVPTSDINECGIEVGNEKMSWEEGKCFIFLDSHRHHTWNNSNHKRYVLVVDVIREEFSRQKFFINSRIILNLLLYPLGKNLNLKFIYKIPKALMNAVSFLLTPVFALLLSVNRKYNILRYA